jgi:hypothetical protein
MTNSELIEKLDQAQKLLSDVYHWACEEQESKLIRNDFIARSMSCADDCIIESMNYLWGQLDEL